MAKRKLKKKFKLVLWVIVIIIAVAFGINRYKLYKYHQTDEYKLLEVGYSEKETKVILDKLKGKQISKLLEQDKKDYLVSLLTSKYFMIKHYNDYLNYYKENKDKSIEDIVAIVNVGATREWYEDTVETDTSKGIALLVNKFHMLRDDYDVGEVKSFSSSYAYGDVSAASECYDAFIKMADAAKEDGIALVLSSGYRSYDEQESTYASMANSSGKDYADKYAARPGASEHETGYALDILSNGQYIYTSNFKESPAYEWLDKHAAEYGFILRYPEGKEHITGYNPESWHYRYIGVDLASKVKSEGITYDEYYAFYLDNE